MRLPASARRWARSSALIALLLSVLQVWSGPVPFSLASEPPPAAIAAVHLARARETRAFTERRLQHLPGTRDCLKAVFVSYARSTDESQIADQWYIVSQIWADLALAPSNEPVARCWATRGFTFLDRLWDRTEPVGGFYAGIDLEGERPDRRAKFADDNSLAGLAWMEAARTARDRLERELLLGRARATAEYLMFGPLWDETFGGGYWWNSELGDNEVGKPAQTNGLAAEFFLELYALTGEPAYHDWAVKILAWLNARLYDRQVQLYRWAVHYAEPSSQRGVAVADRLFNYDQGILIEANLLAYRYLGGQQAFYERAWSLGRRIDPVFWDRQRGGYNLEAGVPQVYTAYSAWLTPSLLMLYEQDGDPYWLRRASANVEALNATTWDRAQGGYFQRHYVCRDPTAAGCEAGADWAVDQQKHTVGQAWMQRAQALLARALLSESR